MSVVDTKSEIAASRAIYFRDLDQGSSGSPNSSETRAKRPSYVGISNSLNGYTPYASYRTGTGRRISPPLHFPSQSQQSHLDSVALVLNQDGFQRSLAEFQETMRDITMGRPESSDITDNARILQVQDQFFPTSHMKEVITDSEGKSVTTITQFHSSASNGSTPTSSQAKKNLVSKQIERLYGGDPFAQIRLTSPEHQVRAHAYEDELGGGGGLHDRNGKDSPERGFGNGGGFFSKRFGITKMKDHSTLRSEEHDVPGEIKPLKVPAVFKLLRPEFREQLKQSSCRVLMPDEEGKERIIPIQRETRSAPAASHHAADPTATPTSRPATERVIPITRLNGNSASTINGSAPPTRHSNSPAANMLNGGTVSPVNGGSSIYSNGRQSPLAVNGSNGTANGHGVQQSLVNGFARRTVPTVIGFRNPLQSAAADKAKSEKDATAAAVNMPAKPLIIRKLSPLSPKHIICPSSTVNSNGTAAVTKPAPAPKPEHLMSPPLSPTPSDNSARSGSPADSCRTGSTMSPCPPITTQDQSPEPEKPAAEPVTPVNGQPAEVNGLTSAVNSLSLAETEEIKQEEVGSREVEEGHVTPTPESADITEENHINGTDRRQHLSRNHNYQLPDEYLEDEDEIMEREQYATQYYGLRERELLCPILEEDNESTASGSLLNLQHAGTLVATGANQGVQQPPGGPAVPGDSLEAASNGAGSSGYSSDDPLLLTEQGEIQDGHYYLKVLENEIFKFEENICDFEEELNMSPDIPEEFREQILSTVGLAKLLMAQKLTQFRGLCDKNINVTKEEDPFVPTFGDLAGFWDMVHIQVEQVHNKFADLQKLRSQGWKENKVEVKPKAKKPMNKNVNKPIKPKEKSEATKARDEARKKMLEAKKRAMKQNKENKENSDLIIMM